MCLVLLPALGAAAASAVSSTALAVGLSIASSAASFAIQKGQAKAQDEYNRQVFKLNKQNAEDSARNQFAAMVKRIGEAESSARSESEQVTDEFQKRIGFAAVSAGEANVGGSSVEAYLNDLKQTMVKGQSNAITQLEFEKANITNQGKGVELETRSRVLSGWRPPTARPNAFGSLLTAATGAFDAYATGKSREKTLGW